MREAYDRWPTEPAGARAESSVHRTASVSAWMTNAARRALLVRDGLQAVAEWEAEQGALTDAELRAARRRVSTALKGSAGPESP